MTAVVLIEVPAGRSGWATVRSPFSAKDILKDTVPSYARTWSKPRRLWMVAQLFVPDLVQALKDARYDVRVTRAITAGPTASPNARTGGVDFTGTFASCPTADMVEAMRKNLLRVHHPDRGADPRIVTAINDAAEARRREVR